MNPFYVFQQTTPVKMFFSNNVKDPGVIHPETQDVIFPQGSEWRIINLGKNCIQLQEKGSTLARLIPRESFLQLRKNLRLIRDRN